MNYEEELNSVKKAIQEIENGAQEYRIGSRTVKRADLSTLYSERQRLTEMISIQNSDRTTTAVLLRRR